MSACNHYTQECGGASNIVTGMYLLEYILNNAIHRYKLWKKWQFFMRIESFSADRPLLHDKRACWCWFLSMKLLNFCFEPKQKTVSLSSQLAIKQNWELAAKSKRKEGSLQQLFAKKEICIHHENLDHTSNLVFQVVKSSYQISQCFSFFELRHTVFSLL